jgi:hypothetical protein
MLAIAVGPTEELDIDLSIRLDCASAFPDLVGDNGRLCVACELLSDDWGPFKRALSPLRSPSGSLIEDEALELVLTLPP